MAEPTEHALPSEEGTPEDEFLYLLSEGSDLLQAGRLDDALRELERALRMRPEHEQAKNLLALALFRIGDLERAQQLFAELVHDNPVEPSLRLNLAMVHLKGGHLAHAYEELERALDLNPEHKRAATYMALVCEKVERFREAATWYAQAGNAEQAAAMRARADEASPAPPARSDELIATSGEGEPLDELMPTPPPADGQVQAAALAKLRADSFAKPVAAPPAEGVESARSSTFEYTLDVDELPEPPPLDDGGASDEGGGFIDPFADDDVRFDRTMPYAPNPLMATPAAIEMIELPAAVEEQRAASESPLEASAEPFDLDESERPLELGADSFDLDEGERPLEVSAESLELREIEPATGFERTLPYAPIPGPPPGRAPLREEPEAVASPPPAVDEVATVSMEAQPPASAVAPAALPPPSGPAVGAAVSLAPAALAGSAVGLAAVPAPLPADPPTPARGQPLPARAHPASAAQEGLRRAHEERPFADATPPPVSSSADARLGRALPPLTLAELCARGAVATTTDAPHVDDDGLVVFPIREVAYLRTDLLVAMRGNFEVEPVYRRYRGRRTDSFFGGQKTPLVAALGDGAAWLDPADDEVCVLSLGDEELYLVETSMLAFSSGLIWENGRLPEAGGRDLDIVHLRGSGRLVLKTMSPLRAVESKDVPVTVAADRLVGWSGSLVPSRGPFPGLPESVTRPSIVRFEGSGRILVV